MNNPKITKLIKKHRLISDQINQAKLEIILNILAHKLDLAIEGDVVELGCYIGTTSLFIQRLLIGTNKKLFVYDSFEGLPEKSREDWSAAGNQFKAGELSITKKDLIHEFKKSNLKLPIIKKSWFSDLNSEQLPDFISLAFLDGDFYNSIQESLNLVWPKLSQLGTIIVDDYSNLALPGVLKACDRFFDNQSDRFKLSVEAGLGIFTKI